jgi:myo-inositol 2-dehydrogenase/D-chiro-inositol 1-dehydrogenase
MTHLAICGIGNIGKVHLENLLSVRGCKVTGIFDVNQAELELAASRFSVAAYRDFDELLNDSLVDAVVVATPTNSHAELCVRALAANKHVFVEKPLAGSLEDALTIANAATHSDRVVQVGFCERFNVNYLEARRAIRSGGVGRIRAIHSSRVAPYFMSNPAWELGVLDTAVHNLDLTLWLMGCTPVSVLTRGVQVYDDSAIPHSATTLLSFRDGMMAVDHIAWVKDRGHPLNQCARSRMLILGDEGTFDIDLTDRASSLLNRDGFRKLDTVIIGAPEYSGCLKLQFEYFLRSIEDGAAVLAPVEDALGTERVAMAALESLRTSREVRLDGIG